MNNVIDGIKELQTNLKTPPLKDLGQKKTKAMVDELNANLPIFERAGFGLLRMEIEMGVSPNIIAMFSICSRMDKEQQHQLLGEVRSNRMLHMVLSLLFKSSGLIDFVNIGDLQFYVMKVTLGTLPKVSLVFNREKNPESKLPVPPPELA